MTLTRLTRPLRSASWSVHLADRAVVSLIGKDAMALLQSYTTNDVSFSSASAVQLKTQTVVGYSDVLRPGEAMIAWVSNTQDSMSGRTTI